MYTPAEPQILAQDFDKISSILEDITKIEGNEYVTFNHPVLIGSRAAKWHDPLFREPKDWNLVATASQSIILLNDIRSNNINLKDIKLVHYFGAGLKIIGECVESQTDETCNFEVEIASNKVNLREIKSNEFEKIDDNN